MQLFLDRHHFSDFSVCIGSFRQSQFYAYPVSCFRDTGFADTQGACHFEIVQLQHGEHAEEFVAVGQVGATAPQTVQCCGINGGEVLAEAFGVFFAEKALLQALHDAVEVAGVFVCGLDVGELADQVEIAVVELLAVADEAVQLCFLFAQQGGGGFLPDADGTMPHHYPDDGAGSQQQAECANEEGGAQATVLQCHFGGEGAVFLLFLFGFEADVGGGKLAYLRVAGYGVGKGLIAGQEVGKEGETAGMAVALGEQAGSLVGHEAFGNVLRFRHGTFQQGDSTGVLSGLGAGASVIVKVEGLAMGGYLSFEGGENAQACFQ